MIKFSFFNKLTVFVVLLFGVLNALPNVLPEQAFVNWPSYLPTKKLNLGLDLQGGSHLVLEVQLSDVVKRAYENAEEEVRLSFREQKINYRRLRAASGNVTLEVFKPEQHAKAKETIRQELQGTSVRVQGNMFQLTFTETRLKEISQRAMAQTLEILRSRVDEFGVSEPIIQRQGESRIIIELPGIDDVGRAKSIIGRTAQLTFHIVDRNGNINRPGVGRTVMYEQNIDPISGAVNQIPYVLHSRPQLTGELLSNASTGFDQQTNEAAVYLRFDGRGTRKFAKITTEHVGDQMAIVLDGVVYSAPVLREPILGGTAQVTGNFTPQTAEDLATVLRAGALPAKVAIVEERTVGPSLGQDSIKAGEIAITVGFIGVLCIMALFYFGFGMAANTALLFNVILIMGTMTAMGFTLTLPGIAGILLTIGMAVDANVLIFERIREESANRKSVQSALDAGFKSAFGTILDANITTLIAAVVLFAMGSGPIKGFALTLSVGIVASMFTAIMVTRMLLILWVNVAKPQKLKV